MRYIGFLFTGMLKAVARYFKALKFSNGMLPFQTTQP